jgi:hypothetical protein
VRTAVESVAEPGFWESTVWDSACANALMTRAFRQSVSLGVPR